VLFLGIEERKIISQKDQLLFVDDHKRDYTFTLILEKAVLVVLEEGGVEVCFSFLR
jgi:hypothetical protein